MRILFLLPYEAPHLGGSYWTSRLLGLELARRGHRFEIAGGAGLAAAPVLRTFRPDAVVVTPDHRDSGWSEAVLSAAAPLPVLLYVQDVGAADVVARVSPRGFAVAAVSGFVARELRARGVEAVTVPPIVDRARYRVVGSRRVALFVKPTAIKGVATALALARARPDVPFAFVRPRPAGHPEGRAVRDAARRLPNVELRPQTDDPAELYGDARVLLVPSAYPEAWGRVITEAQASGIPAVASAVGGLPEAVGAGGLLVDPVSGIHGWRRALSELWDDDAAYALWSARAEREGRRHAVTPAAAGDRIEELLRVAVESCETAPAWRSRSPS